MDLILGVPFSGKSQYAADEIARREAGGELGLLAIDYSRLWTGIVPGVQSSFRDEAVSDTGSPRLVSYAFEVLIAQAIERQLRGYILVNSPRRAARILSTLGASHVLEMDIAAGEVAARIAGHLASIRRRVPRARTPAADSRCAEAATQYYRERVDTDIPVRKVRPARGGWEVGKVESGKFDRDAFLRGLTPAGHDARADLISEGDPDPSPAAIMRRVLLEARRGQ